MTREEVLIRKLIDKNYTITTAESCTGGMIASTLIDVAGVSSVLKECHVTYSNEAKMKYLNVSDKTIDRYGVVSKEVAREMVIGASDLAQANVSIAITGLAGPDGGTKEKPVGFVCIACKVNDKVNVEECIFNGNRYEIRRSATEYAIDMAVNML